MTLIPKRFSCKKELERICKLWIEQVAIFSTLNFFIFWKYTHCITALITAIINAVLTISDFIEKHKIRNYRLSIAKNRRAPFTGFLMDLPIYIFNRIWRPQYLFLAVVLTFCVFYVIIHSNAKTSDGIVLSAAATKGSSDKKSNGKQNEIVLPITDYEIKQRGFKDKIENKNQIDKPLESKRSSVRSMVDSYLLLLFLSLNHLISGWK